jgi:hypothetical protein
MTPKQKKLRQCLAYDRSPPRHHDTIEFSQRSSNNLPF